MRKVSYILACILLLALAASAEKKPEQSGKKAEENSERCADLSFSVLKAETGKPVRNASVVLHSVSKKGKQGSGGLQLKTDSEGKTSFNSVPYGKLRVQVIASGFRTFGQDFEINEPQREIVIKLERPKEQYSIYK